MLARSKVTSQGQISVPSEVRAKLGIGPGSTLEWEEHGDRITVRRAGKYSAEDIHKVLFPEGPPEYKSIDDLKDGVRRYIQKRHARR
jgi:AbrB family looped-hinge helix DNA binding protein